MSKRTTAPLLSITIVRDGPDALHKQLYTALRNAILEGRLTPGARLASSRLMARELGISRNTVMSAYDMLAAEGYTDACSGSATRVSSVLPDDLLAARAAPPHLAADTEPARLSSLVGRLSAPSPRPRTYQGEALQAFHAGMPDLEQFPFNQWHRLISRFWRNPSKSLLAGGDRAGYEPLRRAIADYLRAFRAVECEADQIIITNGAQQALTLACRVLLDPEDDIWLENPAYTGLRHAIAGAGANPVAIDVDDEGLSVTQGRTRAPHARACAVTPSHQYPLGITMSLKRRLELLDWAESARAWIIEDDFDSEFRYDGRPLSALQGLDRTGRVIYAGTFSKVMFPTLRVGYLVVPAALRDAFLRVRRALDNQPPITVQPALAAFMTEGHFATHVRRMRTLYGERQLSLLDVVKRHLGGLLHAAPSQAGMHLCCALDNDLGARLSDTDITAKAWQAGVVVSALSEFYDRTPKQQGLILGYAGFTPAQMETAAMTLARILERTRT